MSESTSDPLRILPRLTDTNRAFWTGGFDDRLLITHCLDCGWWSNPPAAVCRNCTSRRVKADQVSGHATLVTFTINRHRWSPEATAEPYAIGIVELQEQSKLRLLSNIVNCDLERIKIGMKVRVTFKRYRDVALPLFEPLPSQGVATAARPTRTGGLHEPR